MIVVAHRVDPRLLEHDLRHPDAVRVVRFAPGHRALVLVVPTEQVLAKRCALSVGGGEGQFGNGGVGVWERGGVGEPVGLRDRLAPRPPIAWCVLRKIATRPRSTQYATRNTQYPWS